MTLDLADLAGLVAPLRARPADSVLLFDFDGTLSPVVDDPAAAVAAPGVVAALLELASSYRTVGIVSGRPVAFLADLLPEPIVVSGLYGLQLRRDGRVTEPPEADTWRHAVAAAAARATEVAAEGGPLAGMLVEPKGMSLTLHVRTRPELASAVEAFAAEVAAELGLEVRPAKMSVELHPPVDADKGSAVRDLADGAAAVLYVGDDVGDLPAFAELQRLAAEGMATVGLAVGGPELPDAVAAVAAAVLADQAAVVELLGALRP